MTILQFDKFEVIFKQIYELNLLTEIRIITSNSSSDNRQSVYAFEGYTVIEKQSIKLLIGLNKFFPLSLPNIFIRPFDQLGFIPHIDKDGFVCYVQNEGLLLDRNNPVGIIRDALSNSCYARASKKMVK